MTDEMATRWLLMPLSRLWTFYEGEGGYRPDEELFGASTERSDFPMNRASAVVGGGENPRINGEQFGTLAHGNRNSRSQASSHRPR